MLRQTCAAVTGARLARPNHRAQVPPPAALGPRVVQKTHTRVFRGEIGIKETSSCFPTIKATALAFRCFAEL